jgi:hypothetical protein
MAAADQYFGALLPSLGDGSGGVGGMEDSAGGLTLEAERQVQERWDAISVGLCTSNQVDP